MDKSSLCLDPSGVLRGECTQCAGCQSWVFQGGRKIRFKPEDAHGDGPAGAGGPARCEGCGCPAHAHRSLEGWLCSSRRWVQRLRCSDGAWPEQASPTACLPAEARDWAPEAAAIYVVTGGQFEPGRDGRAAAAEEEAGGAEGLVSVVCTTLEKDQAAHPLLYESFRRQSYEPRELVVVDSGTSPSPFLLEKAKEDPRVVYRFFFREEHGLEQAEDPYEHVLKRDDPDEIIEWTEYKEEMPDMERAEVRWEGLSLGLKRNIACHLARGAAVMHFNVNALYAADYVRVMRHQLLAEVAQQQASRRSKPSESTLAPAAVALLDWHTLDFDDEEFRLMDTERRGSEVPEVKRQQVQYGKGLTYTYTRSCWELAPFPDVEEPEGRLAKVLKRESIPLKMVRRPTGHDALVAFGYMKENSCGESATANINLSLEIQILEMCSASVYLPQAFSELLPLARDIVSSVKSRQTGGLQALLQAEGPCFFCKHCDAAIALRRYLKTVKKLGDGAGGRIEIAQFSRAGGAVGEGVEATYEEPPKKQAPRTSGYGGQLPWDRRGIASFAYGGRGQTLGGGHAPFASIPLYGGNQGLRPTQGRPMGMGGMLPGGRGQGLGPNRPMGIQSHQALAAQARALGRPPPILPPQSRAPVQRGGVPEPEPEEASWFPGWWRRNAACRQCGNNIGWRYENEERTIFWVLETAFLAEKEPDPEPPAASAPRQRVPPPPNPLVAPQPTVVPQATAPTPSASSQAAPPHSEEEPAPSVALAPKVDSEEELRKEEEPKKEEDRKEEEHKEEAKGSAPQKGAAERGKQAEKAEKSLETARKAIRAFSPELQQHLAQSIAATDKSKFDQALNEMKLDDATRKNILQELRIRPGVAATQVEHLVAKNFKGKINQLRSLGLRVLRAALQEELPEGTLERLAEAALKESGASGSEGPGGPVAPSRHLQPEEPQGASSSSRGAEGQSSGPAAAAAAAAAASGGGGGGGGGRPEPLPVPDGWEVEWSEPCQCYEYYNEDGQKFFQPPAVEQTGASAKEGKEGSGAAAAARGPANPQEAGLE